MTYSIKLHYLSNPEYETRFDEISDSYNETLELLWKEKEVFYNLQQDELSENDYEELWIDKTILPKEEFYSSTERYIDFFEFKWNRELWESHYQIVKVNFVDIQEDEIDEFQKTFLDLLKDKVQFIYKFEDNRFLEIRKQFFEDIYNIEINLREVISFIFFITYYDYINLLRDLEIQPIIDNISNEKLVKKFENEFFYISFNDYKKLLNLRKLTDEEKTELLRDSDSFDNWKNRIFERGIKDEPYIDFIESIKEDFNILEQIRNSLMHNRAFTSKSIKSYEKVKDEILQKIENFRETHINIFWNELGLIVGKEYTMLKDLPNFIEWKKYQLKELVWFWDWVFIWEDWEEHVFFDKEFDEFWGE